MNEKGAFRRKPIFNSGSTRIFFFIALAVVIHIGFIIAAGRWTSIVPQHLLQFDVKMTSDLTPPDVINQRRPERIENRGPRPVGGSPVPPNTPEVGVPAPDHGMRDIFKLIRENQYEQAEKKIDDILKENPDNEQAIVAKGEISWYKGDLEKAQEYYRIAAEKAPGSNLPLHKLMNNSLLLDDPDSSLMYYEKLKELEAPGEMQQIVYIDALLMRGADRKQKKDERWREDARLAEETAKNIEDNKKGFLDASLGQLYLLTGDRKKSIHHFEQSLKSNNLENDYKIDILMSLAVLYTETGDKKTALKKLDELIELMDKWKPTVYQRGLFVREYALLYKKNILGVEINPDDVFKHERFYRDLYVKKIHRPEVEVKQTLSILSEMPDMSFDEDLPTLIDEVNEYMSISEGPKYPQCFFNKMVNRPTRYMIGFKLYGDIYYHYLKKDKAIYYYRKALELSPDNPVLLECIRKAEKL